MALQEGLYKVEFRTQLGAGAGVVFFAGGRLRGGDGSFAYTGTYAQTGDDFVGDANLGRHTPGLSSVFGQDNVSIRLIGRGSGSQATLEATASHLPNVRMQAVLTRIGD